MARTSSNWGSGYNKFGQTRYPEGPLTRGTIFRGSAPAVNKFRAPNAGVTPNFGGPSRPLVTQQTNGIINKTVNTIAAGGVAQKDENIRARRQRRQQGIDQAKVQLKINNIRNQRAQAGQALTSAWQRAANPPVNPYAQAWNNSPNNPRAPWQVKPPTGSPVTSLPPTPTSPPLSNTGVPALPPQRPAQQARPLNANAPAMPAVSPPPMTPANTNVNAPAPSTPPPPPTKVPTTTNWNLPPVDQQGSATTNVLDFSKPFQPAPKMDTSLGFQPDQEEQNIMQNLMGPQPPAGVPTANSRTQNRPPKW